MGLQGTVHPQDGDTSPARRRAFVRIESGFYCGLEWPLDRSSTVIGRGRNADFVLHEATISRAHALMGYEADRLYVQDLGSTNGVLVNGVREDRALLSEGDELRMGRLVMRVQIDSSSTGGGHAN